MASLCVRRLLSAFSSIVTVSQCCDGMIILLQDLAAMDQCLVQTRLANAHGCCPRYAESTPVGSRLLPLVLPPVSKQRRDCAIRCQSAKVEVEICDNNWKQKKREGDLLESVLWRVDEIQARVAELGQAITTDFDGRPVVVLGVATGAFMFLADLVRHIALPVQVDIIRVQSYGNDTKTSGVATISTDCKIDLKDKHVIVVEDMIDTGITLSKLVNYLASKGAASVSACVLLDKASRRVVPLELSGVGKYYMGFECPDSFIVGYGMDFAERFRTLPCIGVLKPEVYQQKA